MVSTTGEHSAYFELDEELSPVEKEMPFGVAGIGGAHQRELRAGTLHGLFMAGAGGSLRAGVTENPVKLTILCAAPSPE